MNINRKTKVQLRLAYILSIMGMLLLFSSFFTPPVGNITNSVLVAYAQVMTFVGALLGIDYHYTRIFEERNNK